MAKVYIVTENDWDWTVIRKVFSTLEKANDFVASLGKFELPYHEVEIRDVE